VKGEGGCGMVAILRIGDMDGLVQTATRLLIASRE